MRAVVLSDRSLEEMMVARVAVDHTNIYRWVQKFTPLLEARFRRGKKCPIRSNWRMDETYMQIKGQWKYMCRAVDKAGQPVDFPLTAHRDQKAALRFPKKAFRQHGRPVKVTIDPSGANTAALVALNIDIDAHTVPKIEIRQRQYLNNLIEQDHRAIKPITRLIRARVQQLEQHQFSSSGQPPPVTWVSDLLSTPHIARLPCQKRRVSSRHPQFRLEVGDEGVQSFLTGIPGAHQSCSAHADERVESPTPPMQRHDNRFR